MQDVFVSHVEEDAVLALDIASRLESAGFRTWYYERDGVPGVSYLLQTGRAIDDTQAFLVLISTGSLGSHQVTKEIVRAHESNKPILPVLVDVSHVEFQVRQPEWREAVGAAASINLQQRGVGATVDSIVRGLSALGIIPVATLGAQRPEAQPERVPLHLALVYGNYLVQLLNTGLTPSSKATILEQIRALPVPSYWIRELLPDFLERRVLSDTMSRAEVGGDPKRRLAMHLGAFLMSLYNALRLVADGKIDGDQAQQLLQREVEQFRETLTAILPNVAADERVAALFSAIATIQSPEGCRRHCDAVRALMPELINALRSLNES